MPLQFPGRRVPPRRFLPPRRIAGGGVWQSQSPLPGGGGAPPSPPAPPGPPGGGTPPAGGAIPGQGIYAERQADAERIYQQTLAQIAHQRGTTLRDYGLQEGGQVDPHNQYGKF